MRKLLAKAVAVVALVAGIATSVSAPAGAADSPGRSHIGNQQVQQRDWWW